MSGSFVLSPCGTEHPVTLSYHLKTAESGSSLQRGHDKQIFHHGDEQCETKQSETLVLRFLLWMTHGQAGSALCTSVTEGGRKQVRRASMT